MNIAEKVDALEQLAAGTLLTPEAAAKLGLTEAEVARWQEIYAVSAEISARGERARAARHRRAWRRLGAVAAGVTVLFVGWAGSQTAWAQATCAQTLPAPMTTFCPDSPALASSVNGNLQQLVTWLQQKVGTVGSANVTVTGTLAAPTINASGTITAANLNAGTMLTTPAATINGPIVRGSNLPATGDLGLYSQVAGNYMRFVTNAGPFHFFADGAAGNNYVGNTAAMVLDENGNLSVRGQIAGGSIRQRNCAWGPRGPGWGDDSSYHSVYCPAGQYMAGWQCKANGYLDGDCAAWCCSP